MSRSGECESTPSGQQQSLANRFSVSDATPAIESAPIVSAAATAIRLAIVTNSNSGDKVAASLSSRIAARRSRKGKGRFEAKAAKKVDDSAAEFLDSLDDCTACADIREIAEEEHMLLARVTKVVGGSLLAVQLQDGSTGEARIPGSLRAKGKVSHKHHKAHVFGTGDVVLVEHGDVKAKFDSPAVLAHLEGRFRACSFPVPAGFFSSTKDAHSVATALAAGGGSTWEWEATAAPIHTAGKHAGGGAAATAVAEEEEIDPEFI
jgi:translation initiation factor IF-1